MFESAELGHAIDKATFDRAEPRLRKALLAAQYELKDKPEFPVIVVFAGLDAAGKSETANLLNEWLDPRLIETRAFDAPTEEERERPRMWRYFRALPPKGKIGFTFLGWYTEPLIGRFMIYDALRMRFRELKLRKDPECPVCGTNPTVTRMTGVRLRASSARSSTSTS